MTTADLDPQEHAPYFSRYIQKLPKDVELRSGFSDGKNQVVDFFASIPEDKWNHKYEVDKWSIKEVLQHLIDTERIFSYRTFRIGRGDETPLASFDQDIYDPNARAAEKSSEELISEFVAVRDSSLALVNSLTDEDLERVGVASDNTMSSRSAAFIILGHEIWHIDIIKDKYL